MAELGGGGAHTGEIQKQHRRRCHGHLTLRLGFGVLESMAHRDSVSDVDPLSRDERGHRQLSTKGLH